MMRSANRVSQRGILLTEAVLSAVIIAVGLVFITRGFSNQLKAIQILSDHDLVWSLAARQLAAVEQEWLAGHRPPGLPQVAFPPPYDAYEWTLDARPFESQDDAGEPNIPLSEVTLSVKKRDGAQTPSAALTSIWPSSWIPDT